MIRSFVDIGMVVHVRVVGSVVVRVDHMVVTVVVVMTRVAVPINNMKILNYDFEFSSFPSLFFQTALLSAFPS